MTKHRGFTIPEPEEFQGRYQWLDDFGYFNAGTPEGVIGHWKNKVDSNLIKFYIEEDKIALWGRDDYYCLQCGAVLADVFLHIRFHENQT